MRLYYGRNTEAIEPKNMWERFLGDPPRRIAVDTETPNLDDISILGIGVAISPYDAFYITPDEPEFEQLLQILRSPDIWKIYHNAPFDLRVLRQYHVDVDRVDDTVLMARLAMEPSASLEAVSGVYGYISPGDRSADSMRTVFKDNNMETGKGIQAEKLPPEILGRKCCKDALATFMAYDQLSLKINMQYYERVRGLIGLLAKISQQGIKLDQQRREELDTWYTQIYSTHMEEFAKHKLNPNSPKQVGMFLGNRGNYLPMTRKKTQLDTSEAVLSKLKDPVAKDILRVRKVAKQRSTYLTPWIDADRAYTTLCMDTATGRINSTNAGKLQPDRNLQNISKNAELKNARDYNLRPPYSIRSMFVPDNEVFTKADKSQVELRILAHISGDKVMQRLFDNDEDIHEDTRLALDTTRVFAKNFNYGLPYGGDVHVLADTIGIRDLDLVQNLMDKWASRYPQAWEWLSNIEEEGLRNGYVETMGGRKIRIPTELGEKHARNCCRNYPIQGTAFEDITNLMLDSEISKMVDITRLQVHDELIFDGEVELEDMQINIEDSTKEGHPVYDIKGRLAWLSGFYSPLKVEIVKRWG